MKRMRKMMALLMASALTITSVQMNWAVTAEAAAAEGNELAEIPNAELPKENSEAYGVEEVTPEMERGGISNSSNYSDYFDGLEDLADQTVEFTYNNRNTSQQKEISVETISENAYMTYQLKAKSRDGQSEKEFEKVDNATEIGTLDVRLFEDFGNWYVNNKQVGAYELEIEFFNDGESLGKETVVYQVVCESPFTLDYSQSTFTARKDETKRLEINPYFTGGYDGEDDYWYTYQWYKGDKDGNYTMLEEEQTRYLYVKATDFTTPYKCEVNIAGLGVVMEGKSRVITPQESSGYRLKGIAQGDELRVPLGGSASMYIEPAIDDGYKLEYQWEKVSQSSNGTIVYTPIANQTTARYTIPQTTAADFENCYVDWSWVTHRLTVKISNPENVQIGTRNYYFRLNQRIDEPYTIETNNGRLTVEKGEDVQLYARHTKNINDSTYSIEKKWYKIVSGNRVELTTVSEENSVCTIPGKNASGEIVDTRGRYLVEVTITQSVTGGSVSTSEDYYTDIEYDSQLRAYAKQGTVEASVGAAASLEVIASNKNESLYKISYKWQKENKDGTYEDIKDAANAVYRINAVTENDFGGYRAVVSDEAGENEYVYFDLVKKEAIFYTPSRSYYDSSIGDTVTMKVEGNVPASSVSYNWYCTDKYIDYYGPGNYETDTQEWQIINEEGASYSRKINSEEDFGTYKCEVHYKLNGTYCIENFYFVLRDTAKNITVERTTPYTQYAKIGGSASYGVRCKFDAAVIQPSKIAYQWYDVDGEPIEGAVSENYTAQNLGPKDFGSRTCEIEFTLPNRTQPIQKTVSFRTELYTDVTVTGDRRVGCTLGTDVTLAPVINNPSNRTLTYQWYGPNGMIRGADASSYTISQIGGNQTGHYTCYIYDRECLVATYEVRVYEEGNWIEVLDYAEEVTVLVGGKATLAVKAESSSNLPLHYQWYKVGYYDEWDEWEESEAIGGATDSEYVINYALPEMAGRYKCRIEDSEGNSTSVYINLVVTTGLDADSGYENIGDTIGYPVQIGGTVELATTASVGDGYNLFYQWYKSGELILGETSETLTISNITLDDLGYYRCEISDGGEYYKILRYYVYVDTGLVVEPSIRYPRAAADGSITMYVEAKANAGETIKYQWAKYSSATDEYEDISGATAKTYKISKIVKDSFGEYRCTVSTSGESNTYYYSVYTMYEMKQSRDYAEQGDAFTAEITLVNPATDAEYTYQWYEQDPENGGNKIVGNSSASYATKAPEIRIKNSTRGYKTIDYTCQVLMDGQKVERQKAELKVLADVNYVTKLPETSHPFDKRVDIQGYRVTGAKKIEIKLDDKSELIRVIDASGQENYMGGGLSNTLTLEGGYAIFLIGGESYEYYGSETRDVASAKTDGTGYGYKVISIKDANPSSSSTPTKPSSSSGSTGSSTTQKVPAKGTTYKVGNVSYKVTKSHATAGTVAVTGGKTKKVTSVTIPKTVKINGYTFKVTKVNAKAFNGYKKLTKVVIGANIASIGQQAFKGCSKLKTINIKTTKLTAKKVGKQAFKGIVAKAKITVPKSKLANYKKILTAKGVGKKATIKK